MRCGCVGSEGGGTRRHRPTEDEVLGEGRLVVRAVEARLRVQDRVRPLDQRVLCIRHDDRRDLVRVRVRVSLSLSLNPSPHLSLSL